MIKKIIYTILLFLLSTISYNAYSCSCAEIKIERAFETSDYIFKGKIKKIRKNIFANKQVVEIEIIKEFKGKSEKKTVTLRTPYWSSTCGLTFIKGKEYIVYASQRKVSNAETYFFSNRCSRTTINIFAEEKIIECYLKDEN